ncbi:MAG: ATP-binding protein [Pseudomonadales bacterium]
MLNLYWKIFLAFWLSTLLMIGGAFWLSQYIPVNNRFEQGPPPRALAREARRMLISGDIDEFERWSSQLKQRHHVEFFLFSHNGMPLFDTNQSPYSAAQWREFLAALSKARGNMLPKGRHIYVSRSAHHRAFHRTENDIARYVMKVPAPKSEFERLFIRNASIRVGISVVISGLLCLLLARYFTVPIRRLRTAMNQVSAGDYGVRTMAGNDAGNDELKLLAADFDRMTEKVQDTLGNQARLIKDVSHELRSPLARLQAALGLAQQKTAHENNSKDISAELNRIESEVQAIDELIEQILSLPQQNIVLTDAVDIKGLLTHCIENCSVSASNKNLLIDLETKLDEAVVATRGRLLNSVFENLLQNAIRFAPKNSRIKVQLTEENQQYQIAVQDQGPGVDPQHLEKLFTPFYRASEARERDAGSHSGGHGLGLAIAERNVRLHKGQIIAENVTPSGLCVRVSLPVDRETPFHDQ